MQGFLNLDGGGVGQPSPSGREDNKKEAGFTLSSKLSLEEAGYTLRVSSPRGDSNPQHEVAPQCLCQEKSP